jgi:hypothetical protein
MLFVQIGCSSEKEIDGKKLSEWVNLLRHDDWTIQAQASDVLVRQGAVAVPYLKKLLNSTDPTMRRGVVLTLGKIGPPAKSIIPSLLARMAREEVGVIRGEILKSLIAIDLKSPQVIAELKKRQRDVEVDVRKIAKSGLRALTAPVEKKEDKQQALAKQEMDKSFLLREVLTAQFKEKGISFGLIAEVARESKRAAIVWPAIKEGKVIDDDIVAYVFERKDGKDWTLSQADIGLSVKEGPNRLADALGGADKQRVVKPCGVAKNDLGSYMSNQAKLFKEALNNGKADEAVLAYEELTKAFSFRLAAYDDAIPEMLINEIIINPSWKMTVADQGNSALIEVEREGTKSKVNLDLRACDDGWAIVNIK